MYFYVYGYFPRLSPIFLYSPFHTWSYRLTVLAWSWTRFNWGCSKYCFKVKWELQLSGIYVYGNNFTAWSGFPIFLFEMPELQLSGIYVYGNVAWLPASPSFKCSIFACGQCSVLGFSGSLCPAVGWLFYWLVYTVYGYGYRDGYGYRYRYRYRYRNTLISLREKL